MLKSKDKDYAFSFIMGVDSSFKEKLDSIGTSYEIENDECYLTKIPVVNCEKYEQLISEYLKPGFWNEYISEKIIFIFKDKDGNIIRYELDSNNEQEVLKLCNEYANFNMTSIEEMLLGNSFYKKNSMV